MQLLKQHKNRRGRFVTAVFFITVFIACVPLISKYCINGHDLDYHLLRIESLKEGIRMGKPFLKVNPLYFGGAGYASSMFYPDFMLYIPAFLRVMGVSINSSYHIFIAICIILCYLSAYKCVREMTGSTYGAMTAAVILTLCPYHLDDIYIRSAVGEYTAFIFIPIIIYAMYNVVYEDMDKPQLFVLGYAGVLLCHTSTFIMCTVFGIAVLLINYRKIPGYLGVCAQQKTDGDEFKYFIGCRAADVEGVPEGFEILHLPEYTWAVFKCVGPMPDAIQEMWEKIYKEWLPVSDYELIPDFDIENYLPGDTSSQDSVSEICIPVCKSGSTE